MLDSERTIAFVPEEQRGKTATLIILDMRNRPVVVPLQGNMTLGRDYDKSNCDIRVQSRITDAGTVNLFTVMYIRTTTTLTITV